MTAAARGGKMSTPRKERRPLLVGLFASLVGSALVLPDPGLADAGKSPSYVKMDHREATGGRSVFARQGLRAGCGPRLCPGTQPSHPGGNESLISRAESARP